MVLRSCPRCRAIAEIVQPRRCNACASTSSSRVIIEGGGPFRLRVVRDQQPRGDLRRLGGATRVGKFSEQVWGASPERRQKHRVSSRGALGAWPGKRIIRRRIFPATDQAPTSRGLPAQRVPTRSLKPQLSGGDQVLGSETVLDVEPPTDLRDAGASIST